MTARVVHCKRAPFDVYIGRPSKWGNPFPVPSKSYDRVADPDRILERYEAHVRARPDLMAALPELRGKVLGCWCAPQRCHGDVLVRLADEGVARFPVRECKSCGWKTTSTSILDFCLKCRDEDGLRPKHFLTRIIPASEKPEVRAPECASDLQSVRTGDK